MRDTPTQAHSAGETRLKRIAVAAYLRAESRHFAPGHEVADWLAAEAAVDREIAREMTSPPRASAPAQKPLASSASASPASTAPAAAAIKPAGESTPAAAIKPKKTVRKKTSPPPG